MLRVRRNQNVSADVHAGTGAFLERDNRQAIEKVVQDLLALLSCLLPRCHCGSGLKE